MVYVQGHGRAGSQNIYANNMESSSAADEGQMLNKMNLPSSAEVRANSCYSGTQKNIRATQSTDDVHQAVKNNTLDVNMAGDWNKTFAGGLEKSLHGSSQRNNRVLGYMGPTGVYASDSVSNVNHLGKELSGRHIYSSPGRNADKEIDMKYKKSLLKRTGG